MLLDIEGVELPGTIDHVTLAEMNTVTRLASLDLLQKKKKNRHAVRANSDSQPVETTWRRKPSNEVNAFIQIGK